MYMEIITVMRFRHLLSLAAHMTAELEVGGSTEFESN